MPSTKIKITDIVVLAAVLLLSLALLFGGKTGEKGALLRISTADGAAEYGLNENQVLTVTSGCHALTVEIKDGAARVTESDCKDKICVCSGRISRDGESILCAPNGVRISVEKEGNYDFVAG